MKPNDWKTYLKKQFLANPKQAVFVMGKVGVGKCIHFNSKSDFVLSGDGKMLQIKDLPKKILTLNNKYKLEKSKVKKDYNREVTKLLRITTNTGKKIELTPEHPLYTIDGWQEAQKLKKGGYIATPRIYNLNLKKTISIDYVKIIAYLLAEGSLSGNGIQFTNSDKLIIKELKYCVEKYYPFLTLKKISGKYAYNISRKDLSNKKGLKINKLKNDLEHMSLMGKTSGTKFIPNDIMELSNKQIAIFLNRFYSCDGWASNNQIGVCLKSEIMIRQIQHLLLRFGIISTIYKKLKYATNTKEKKKYIYWELLITSNDGKKIFKNDIGFFLKRKLDKIKINKKTNTNIDIIPINPVKKQEFREDNGRFKKGHTNKLLLPKLPTSFNWKYPSRDTLNKFADYYKDNEYKKLANSDIFWDKIKSIEVLKGKFEVWDIEVEHLEHNFIANDIIVHNSMTTQQVAVELEKETKEKWLFTDIRLSLLDATDLRGLPDIDKEKRETYWTKPVFLPPEDSNENHILFFDEFSNANASIQNACLQLVLDRSIGEYKLPPKTRIVCGGNGLNDGAFVFKLSSALGNRFINIDFEADFDDWKVWAYANKINPLVIAYHNYTKGDNLYNFSNDTNVRAFASPRTWAFVGQPNGILDLGLHNGTLYEVIKGAIGEGVGTEFYGFLKIYRDLPNPNDILEHNKNIVPEESNVMYALVSALINTVREKKEYLDRLIEYTYKIPKEFAVLLMKDILKTDLQTDVLNSKVFDKWTKDHKEIIL